MRMQRCSISAEIGYSAWSMKLRCRFSLTIRCASGSIQVVTKVARLRHGSPSSTSSSSTSRIASSAGHPTRRELLVGRVFGQEAVAVELRGILGVLRTRSSRPALLHRGRREPNRPARLQTPTHSDPRILGGRNLMRSGGSLGWAGVEVKLTHIGGPTVLIEFGGWRLLTDPTFDPAGGKYRFGWGTGSTKLTAPSICRRGARPDRRGAAQPRPPRRQPRRRRPGAAAAGGDRADDRGGRAPARRQRPRPRALGDHRADRRGQTADRGHRHALPPRPAAEQAAGRRRRRLRAYLGGTGARRPLDLRRHGPLRRRPRGRRSDRRRHRARSPRRRPLPGHRPAALHDDRRRGDRAAAKRCNRRPRSRSTTRAGITSAKAASRSRPSSPRRRRRCANGSAGCRSAAAPRSGFRAGAWSAWPTATSTRYVHRADQISFPNER